MSKERLEEIEKKYSEIKIIEVLEDVEIVAVDFKDLVYLIKNSFKQAERVQELEKLIDKADEHDIRNGKEIMKLTDEKTMLGFVNNRYREAITEIENAWKFTKNYQEHIDVIQEIIKELEGGE